MSLFSHSYKQNQQQHIVHSIWEERELEKKSKYHLKIAKKINMGGWVEINDKKLGGERVEKKSSH